MIERLVLARTDLRRDCLPPLLGVVELRIDIEDHAPERIDAVLHHLAHLKPSISYHCVSHQKTFIMLAFCVSPDILAAHLATLNFANFVANQLPKGGAMKRNLTDRTLKSLKPTKQGTHVDVWDLGFPGFGVRVSDTGRRTFILAARYPGSRNPTRLALG